MEGAKSSGFWRKSLHKVKSKGQTIEESAQMFTNIISGNGTEAQNNVVCANAGMAIATTTRNVHRSKDSK
jgi:anthranilate phosphoribosyltransferase